MEKQNVGEIIIDIDRRKYQMKWNKIYYRMFAFLIAEK